MSVCLIVSSSLDLGRRGRSDPPCWSVARANDSLRTGSALTRVLVSAPCWLVVSHLGVGPSEAQCRRPRREDRQDCGLPRRFIADSAQIRTKRAAPTRCFNEGAWPARNQSMLLLSGLAVVDDVGRPAGYAVVVEPVETRDQEPKAKQPHVAVCFPSGLASVPRARWRNGRG